MNIFWTTIITVLVTAFFTSLFTGGFVKGFLSSIMPARCAHPNPAVFRFGPEESGNLVCHCFTCGLTRVNDDAWTERGIRSGNELNDFLACLDEEATPTPYPTGVIPDDMPPSLPINGRVHFLLASLPNECKPPNAVMLGRRELSEVFPILVNGLERAEQWRAADTLKLIQNDVDAPEFLMALQSLEMFGLKIIPALEHDSMLALTNA